MNNIKYFIIYLFLASLLGESGSVHAEAGMAAANGWIFKGPLRQHPRNPRYFTDDGNRAVYLAGVYQWHDLHDCSRNRSAWARLLRDAKAHKHNLIRLWVTESTLASASNCSPTIFTRSGSGRAFDGHLKYNAGRVNPAFLHRLRDRVSTAQKHGIYVVVMLFQGFNVAKKKADFPGANPWIYHPFNRNNNVNGINGDINDDGQGYEVHTLANRKVTAMQEAYVRQVINAVNGFDNVIFEISNESHGDSTQWQYHMIDFIKRTELSRGKRHPVVMSFQWDHASGSKGTNGNLINSEAEAISPAYHEMEPPVSPGSKVTVLDTDHLMTMPKKWGAGSDGAWVWKSFMRGMNLSYLDLNPRKPDSINSRKAMGLANELARRVNLAQMTPAASGAVCSTRYCLYSAGRQYLVFQPRSGAFQVNLRAGSYRLEWLNPRSGSKSSGGAIRAGSGMHTFTSPFRGPAVLYAYRQ